MRVLVTRPEAEAVRTAERLRQAGHAPVVIPLLRTVRLAVDLPEAAFDAVLATSPHAFPAGPLSPALLSRPLFSVGSRTAEAARGRGFAQVRAPARDAATLLAQILAAWPTTSARLLYLAGRDRKPTLEAGLGTARHAVTVVETYAVQAADTLPDELARLLSEASLDAVLHYSARGAGVFRDLVGRAGAEVTIVRLVHHCLSADVAGALGMLGARTIVASQPSETALLATLRPSQDANLV